MVSSDRPGIGMLPALGLWRPPLPEHLTLPPWETLGYVPQVAAACTLPPQRGRP